MGAGCKVCGAPVHTWTPEQEAARAARAARLGRPVRPVVFCSAHLLERIHEAIAEVAAARADLAELRERVAELRRRFESYAGGDRPMSPPVRLIRELASAEAELSTATDRPIEP